MFKSNFFRKHRWVLTAVVLLLIYAAAVPQTLSAGVCEKALGRCLTDAAISAILGANPAVFAVFSTSCFLGYSFCLNYYPAL